MALETPINQASKAVILATDAVFEAFLRSVQMVFISANTWDLAMRLRHSLRHLFFSSNTTVVYDPQYHKTACNHLEAFSENTRCKGLLLGRVTSAVYDDVGHLRADCGSAANGVYTLLTRLECFLWHAQGKQGLMRGLKLKHPGVPCTATGQNPF